MCRRGRRGSRPAPGGHHGGTRGVDSGIPCAPIMTSEHIIRTFNSVLSVISRRTQALPQEPETQRSRLQTSSCGSQPTVPEPGNDP